MSKALRTWLRRLSTGRTRRLVAAVVVVAGAATVIGLLLAERRHDWPYDVIAVAVACAAIGGCGLLFGFKRVLGGAGAVAAALITALTLYHFLVPKTEIEVEGTVTCANHAAVAGVFIKPYGAKQGFADWKPMGRLFRADYTYPLEKRASFKIGVGCGKAGSGEWVASLSSDYVSYGHRDFICYDRRDRAHSAPRVRAREMRYDVGRTGRSSRPR